jgi:hypothetical protein
MPIPVHPIFGEQFKDLATPSMVHLSLWIRLGRILDSLEKAQQCCAHDCLSLISEHPLKLYTGCGLARYCSRRCQQRAWRHSTIPHHDVCSELARLCADMDISKINITAELQKRMLMPGGEALQGWPGMLLFNHFRALCMHKMGALGINIHVLPN